MINQLLRIVVFVVVLHFYPARSHSGVMEDNKIVVGPGYDKAQQSQQSLTFVPPAGWVKDEKAAKKLGLQGVMVPTGMKLENASKAITIAFQKKDPAKPGLANLKNFFTIDMQNTMTQFPDCQATRWQPSGLDPAKVNFYSIELYGKEKGKPSPHHLLILDGADGYFSITLTAETLTELRRTVYEDFFNSIKLN